MYSYIYGMSTSKRQIQSDLRAKSHETTKHILKLMLFPNSRDFSHWGKEIYAFINSVDRSKGKNKYPSERIIYDALSTQLDIIANLLSVTVDENDELIPECIDVETAEDTISNYYKWLAKELASKGKISKQEYIEEMNKLGFSIE